MKKLLTILFLCLASNLFSQTTLTLRPNAANGKDALVDSRTAVANTNFGNSEDIASWAWTSGGATIARSFFQFDLTSIPSNAVITNARLSLYCNTTSAITQLHSGTNASFLQRVTSSWNESTVTWANQPSATNVNQVSLANSNNSTENYLNIDVKQLVMDMKNNPSSSYGFMIKLQTEATFRSMIFASSDHPDSLKRPTLIVTYTLPPVCSNTLLTLQPNASQGKDALIDSRSAVAGTNFGTITDFAAWAWTNGGPTTARSLLEFNLSALPANAVITGAKLSLFCNTNSSVTQLHSGANESYLQRITSAWDEGTVNWTNQPTTTSVNQVSVAASSFQTQDFLNIDVMQLVNDMLNNGNYGFMLKLQTEALYRSLILSSSDHADANKRPKLEICYLVPAYSLVTSPNGGEKLIRGTNFPITWSSSPATNVKIVYSTNNGQTWNTITNSTPASAGTYLWAVPNVISNQCKVKILNAADSLLFDESDNNSSIINPPQISLLSPNGGEIWFNNNSGNITWTSSYSNKVKIEYSLNNTTWMLIADSLNPIAGSYLWNLPPIQSNTVKVRIRDCDYLSYGDTSTNNFTIRNRPIITITSPNGGENFLKNTVNFITWTATNSNKVNIYYTLNDTSYINIANDVTSSLGAYSWMVPNVLSNTVRIKIVDADFNTFEDVSNGQFAIITNNCPNTLILQPNASQGKDALVDSRTAVANTNHGNTEDLASWAWTIGGNLTYARSLFQFDLSQLPANAIISGAKLSLYCNTVSAVTQLHSGTNESYLQRITSNWQENTVTWNNQPTTSTSNQVSLANSTSQTQNYLNINVTQLINDMRTNPTSSFGFMLKLKLEEIYKSLIFASSDHADSTKRPKLEICYTLPTIIQVNSPNGGEKIVQNKTHLITWMSSNMNHVKIHYSIDNGLSWNTITDSVSASPAAYLWNVPNVISNTCKIRISSLNNPMDYDLSDSNFAIVNEPFITVTTPNGGESWFNNSPNTISWTSSGINNVKIAYSLNSGTNWTTIGNTNSNANGGSFIWNVPVGILSTNARIRVSDLADSSKNDQSNADFTIQNSTGLSQPEKDQLVKVYPNPSIGDFAIEFNNHQKPYSLKLINLNGQIIYEHAEILDQVTTVNLAAENKKAGIYLLEIKSETDMFIRKIFIY